MAKKDDKAIRSLSQILDLDSMHISKMTPLSKSAVTLTLWASTLVKHKNLSLNDIAE